MEKGHVGGVLDARRRGALELEEQRDALRHDVPQDARARDAQQVGQVEPAKNLREHVHFAEMRRLRVRARARDAQGGSERVEGAEADGDSLGSDLDDLDHRGGPLCKGIEMERERRVLGADRFTAVLEGVLVELETGVLAESGEDL